MLGFKSRAFVLHFDDSDALSFHQNAIPIASCFITIKTRTRVNHCSGKTHAWRLSLLPLPQRVLLIDWHSFLLSLRATPESSQQSISNRHDKINICCKENKNTVAPLCKFSILAVASYQAGLNPSFTTQLLTLGKSFNLC